MHSILFTIPLDGRTDLGPLGQWPVFGPGLLLGLWTLLGLAVLYRFVREFGWKELPIATVVVWVVIGAVLFSVPGWISRIPVYGYGTMLFLGFLTAAWVASRRLQNQGHDGEIAWDAAMWVFVAGIVGARLFYVMQYHERFIGPDPVTGVARTFKETVKSLVNLPDGGLVFYGGLIGSAIAFYVFCRARRIHPLALADIVITSVFIGMAFGRIGCLLNGCCYGDLCTLPWALTFPAGSVPFDAEVHRGFLAADAARSLSIHPTQIYSALNAAVLALLTWAYYPYRRRDGEVLALGWLAYPVSRFAVEFLRGDEMGQFGTSLTISQWVSLGLIATGALFYFLTKKYTLREPLMG